MFMPSAFISKLTPKMYLLLSLLVYMHFKNHLDPMNFNNYKIPEMLDLFEKIVQEVMSRVTWEH